MNTKTIDDFTGPGGARKAFTAKNGAARKQTALGFSAWDGEWRRLAGEDHGGVNEKDCGRDGVLAPTSPQGGLLPTGVIKLDHLQMRI
jgi:hypothetical protein